MDSYQLFELFQFALVIIFIIGFVATVMWFKKKENDNRTKVLLTALEKGQEINPELLATKKKNRSINKWGLLALLIAGSGMTFLGIAVTITQIVSLILRPVKGVYNNVTVYASLNELIPCFLALAMGIALLIGYFVGKKLLKPEVDKETADELAKK